MHQRKIEDKRRLEKLAKATPNCYFKGAWYDEYDKRFKKIQHNKAMKILLRDIKRIASKKARYSEVSKNGCTYKKTHSICNWF